MDINKLTENEVKLIIRSAFPKLRFNIQYGLQMHMLEVALRRAQTILGTQDLKEAIKWAWRY